MSLTKESAYLYSYAKKLRKINREIKKHSKHADKHKRRHNKAKTLTEQDKHKRKHESKVIDINKLAHEHRRIMQKLLTHYRRFTHELKSKH